MIITTSLYLAHFTTGPLYLFYILAVVTFPVAVAKSGIALLQVKTQSCSQNNPSQFVFRDILLLSTWLAWTPRRGRRSRRSRGLYFRVCRGLLRHPGVDIHDYTHPCALAGACWGWQVSKLNPDQPLIIAGWPQYCCLCESVIRSLR